MARILIGKLGTDAHDMGITVVARWLEDAGHEVIHAGLYNTPERIVEIARKESPDLIGLSFHGGEPVYLSGRVIGFLNENGMDDLPVIVGGIVTPEMAEELRAAGVAALFTPGTPRQTILDAIAGLLAGDRRNVPPVTARRNPAAP